MSQPETNIPNVQDALARIQERAKETHVDETVVDMPTEPVREDSELKRQLAILRQSQDSVPETPLEPVVRVDPAESQIASLAPHLEEILANAHRSAEEYRLQVERQAGEEVARMYAKATRESSALREKAETDAEQMLEMLQSQINLVAVRKLTEINEAVDGLLAMSKSLLSQADKPHVVEAQLNQFITLLITSGESIADEVQG